ncbi:MAG TPA: flagellar hook-length control protein FliK [Bacillota bacterium]|nr:flagellar hook-length control protein FliK [Bacillota bacterium]
MIDPFMANVGTGGIVVPKTEANVPVGNTKTMEPGETDFQTILENVCSDTVEKPTVAKVESKENQALKPSVTGEMQVVSGSNQLGKEVLQAEVAAENSLSSDGEIKETDSTERQTPVNHEIISVMALEMLAVNRNNTLAPAAEAKITSGEITNLQSVMNATDIARPVTNGNPNPVVPSGPTGIKEAVSSQNAESEVLPQLLGPTQNTANHSAPLEQAEVFRAEAGLTPLTQRQNLNPTASWQPKIEPAGSENQNPENRQSSIQSNILPEQWMANTEQSLRGLLNTAGETQTVKPLVKPDSEVKLPHPVEQTVTLKATVKPGEPIVEKAAAGAAKANFPEAIAATTQMFQSTPMVNPTEPSVISLQSDKNLSPAEMKMSNSSSGDGRVGVVEQVLGSVTRDLNGMQPEMVQSAEAMVNAEMQVAQSRLPEDNLKGQSEGILLQPVRDLQQQMVVEKAVVTGMETKGAGTLSQSVAISQVLSETVSPETKGISPRQSAEALAEVAPSEISLMDTDLTRGIDSNLNLAMAQLSLQKKPILQNHGGKPPVSWNANAIIQGIRPQIVENNTTLPENIKRSIPGETLTQTSDTDNNLVAITVGQGLTNPDNSTTAERFGSNYVPMQQPVTGDPAIPTVQSAYSWQEVLQSFTAPQIAKSSVEAEKSTEPKSVVLQVTAENQPSDVPTVLTFPVAENQVKVTPEANLKTEPVVNKQEVFSQLVEQAKLMVNQGQSEMELSLKPEHLGKLKLKIAVDQQVVTAQFTVESEQVKQIIETNLVQLRKLLQDTGAQVENLTITVGQQDAGTNFSQQSNSDGHRSRSHQTAALVTKEGLDFAPEITKPTQSRALIDLIA